MAHKGEIIKQYLDIRLINENIIYIKVVAKQEFTLDVFNAVSSKIDEYSKNTDFHLITDISKHTTAVKTEVRSALENYQKNRPNFLSNNVIANNMWTSVLLGAFLKIIKLSIPTNVFSSLEKAIEYIEESY